MIYGNIEQVKEYEFLEDRVKECLTYALENDLANLKNGVYKIDGENLFVNIVEYETENIEDRFLECHKRHLDVHVMLNGKEKIGVNFTENLKEGEYNEEGDLLVLHGENKGEVVLTSGDFLVLYPNDAHMTSIKVNEKEKIKKAIFKVKIK